MKKKGTGFNSKFAYGVFTRKLNMSRGGREGNNAFLQDIESKDQPEQIFSADNEFTEKLMTIVMPFC